MRLTPCFLLMKSNQCKQRIYCRVDCAHHLNRCCRVTELPRRAMQWRISVHSNIPNNSRFLDLRMEMLNLRGRRLQAAHSRVDCLTLFFSPLFC